MPVPAEPSVVGAYLASLTDKAPTTIRRRLAALAETGSRPCWGRAEDAADLDRGGKCGAQHRSRRTHTATR